MSKTLVLAEKPSVARDIARVLGVRGASGSTADGFMESDDWIVTWALGHLVALSEPDAIDPRYKAWRMDTLPMLPDDMEVLHVSHVGRIHTLIVRGNATDITNRLAVYAPILMEAPPLTLEEIFIYELGGEDYAVRDIVL